MSAENFFEGLREMVEKYQPEALAGFDRLAHRLHAHKDDEIFALIEAASLSAKLAGSEVRAATSKYRVEMEELLVRTTGQLAGLSQALAEAQSIPAAIEAAAASVNVRTKGIEQAAKNVSSVTGRILIIFTIGGGVLGGVATVLLGKFFGLL